MVQVSWVSCQRPRGRWNDTQETWTIAEIVHMPLKMGYKKDRNM
jgi:hypothetical protein